MPARLFVSAGESSGDRHLADVLAALERIHGPVEIRGLGGPRVAARGATLLAGLDRLSVIGFSEVARRLPFFLSLQRRVRADLRAHRPDLVLLVDYPGFNLRVGRMARALGIPVLYYVAPQIWAWRRERRPGIARAVDRLLVVFPFEEPLFREAGIDTAFVGHPLLDAPAPTPGPAGVRERLGVGPDEPLLALLPGSRAQEVRHILPPLAAGGARLEGIRVAVSRKGGLDADLYQPALDRGQVPWDGSAAALAAAADAALVASGTATLETGLLGTPLGVVYRTGPVNWWIARRVVALKTVGLVNIAAGGTRVPELLQDDLTPSAVADLARRLLFDERERAEQAAYLAPLRERLGGGGSAERVAVEAARFLGERDR